MPICPRCGKCLSSEQALTYHLNRKYKCGTWNCVKCLHNFNTKFQLQIHEMSCLGDRSNEGYKHPSTDTLLKIYNSLPVIIIECDANTKKIMTVSPQCERVLGIAAAELIGKTTSECIQNILYNTTYKLHELQDNLVCII